MEKSAMEVEVTRYGGLSKFFKGLFVTLTSLGIFIAAYYVFHWTFLGTLFQRHYFYLIMGVFGSIVFLILPARKKDKGRIPPWYDLVAFSLLLGVSIYFFLHSDEMISHLVSWLPPTTPNFITALIVVILLLEAARRTGRLPYFVVCLIIGAYPLFAGYLPGVLFGIQFSLGDLLGEYMYGSEGIVGLPSQVLGEILLGFLIFAGMLLASGAGEFFIKLAYCLLGRFRGGPAKVAVVASGFFGSLSGSVVSNVVGTGSITIPAMKRVGYPPHYAGAIEACASTGGVLMPPVMGAVAFIMAEILSIDYAEIIVAAFIPSVLYYLGLLMQVDAYAAKVGLRGLPREDIPSLKQTLKEGWIFIFVIIFLVWGLLYMRWSTITPYYAAALLVILSYVNKKTALTPRKFVSAIATIGILIAQMTGILLPIGLIVGGLMLPGMAGALTASLVTLGGTSIWLVLLIGIVVCYVFGMMGMITAAYIILAVTMAPVVITVGGLNTFAVHLFIIYYAMLAAITPPVALGAFTGAAIAGAPAMKTAWTATRLGIVIYFIPFFFLFNPALILQGSGALETLYLFALAFLGLAILSAGVEGYLFKIGTLRIWERPLLAIAGFLIAFPETLTTVIGALAALITAIAVIIRKR